MRLERDRDARQHADLASIGTDDHHPLPKSVSFTNILGQVIAGGGTYNLDVSLTSSAYQVARVILFGPRTMFSSTLKEGGEIVCTRSASEAMAISCKDTTLTYKVYAATYSKSQGDAYLTMAVFDNNTGNGNNFICVQDAVLAGSVLRLTFKNITGGNATLWVKGQVLAW
mgnify:CR=1 FL=1